jgi:hypothetical protein
MSNRVLPLTTTSASRRRRVRWRRQCPARWIPVAVLADQYARRECGTAFGPEAWRERVGNRSSRWSRNCAWIPALLAVHRHSFNPNPVRWVSNQFVDRARQCHVGQEYRLRTAGCGGTVTTRCEAGIWEGADGSDGVDGRTSESEHAARLRTSTTPTATAQRCTRMIGSFGGLAPISEGAANRPELSWRCRIPSSCMDPTGPKADP